MLRNRRLYYVAFFLIVMVSGWIASQINASATTQNNAPAAAEISIKTAVIEIYPPLGESSLLGVNPNDHTIPERKYSPMV